MLIIYGGEVYNPVKMLKTIIIGLFCFVLFLALHIVIFRTMEIKRRFKTLVIIFFSLFPIYALLYFLIPSDTLIIVPVIPSPVVSLKLVNLLYSALNFMIGLMLYVFLFLGYCQFYFIVDRSISVRVMIEIEDSPVKKLTFEEIERIYNFNTILSRRIEHMKYGKYIVDDKGYYINTKKGKFEAKVFRFLKEFLRLGPGG